MSFPVNYETAMTQTASLAMDKNEPGYVRVRALVALVRELSPLNERHLEVKRELNIDEARVVVTIDHGAENRAFYKGFNAALERYQINENCECVCDCPAGEAETEEEEPAEEEADPL